MSKTEIKTNIQEMINKVEDENFLNDIYAMLNAYANGKESMMTESQKVELDKRLESHRNGESGNLSLDEVKQKALARIRK